MHYIINKKKDTWHTQATMLVTRYSQHFYWSLNINQFILCVLIVWCM